MPRTKAAKNVKKSGKRSTNISPEISLCLRDVEMFTKIKKEELEKERDNLIEDLRAECRQILLTIPVTKLGKTIGELRSLSTDTTSSTISTIGINSTMKPPNKTLRRSRSFALSDEGYHTTDSSNTTTGRQSRLRQKHSQSRSRSLSKSKKLSKLDLKTPSARQPPNSYGLITPKVGPNTPQVLLRRPKQGEVALSLQGSPLFTGSVVSETIANINIPLDDGRLLSIQPERGLRMSQIPHLDSETTRQLEALKDNLIKVCAINMQK